MLLIGNMFGMLPTMAVPNHEDIGLDLSLLGKLLAPLGCTLGVWVVGNIGGWKGSLRRPVLGCYLTLPAYLYGMNVVSWTTILGTVMSSVSTPSLSRISTGAYCFKRQWRTPTKSSRSWYTRIMVLTLCGSLYLSMWSSYLYFNAEVVHNGDKIKLREAVANFLKSPAVQVQCSRNIEESDNFIFRSFHATCTYCGSTCCRMDFGQLGLSWWIVWIHLERRML